jgi:subtilisin family serine protease
MPRRLALAALAAALLPAAGATATARAADPLTGRLLVTLAEPADGPAKARTARAAQAVAAVPGARPGGRFVPELGLVTVRPERGRSLRALRARLQRRADVADVRPERRFALRAVPNDPALTAPETAPGTPPGIPVQWWAERLGLLRAWDVFGGEGARVAVIDTGVDATHPDLADRIELAVDRDSTPTAGPATVDEAGHGTHVASLACGGGDNGIGLAGAGLNCRLLVFKSDLTEGSVAQSIVEATDAGAHAITMSFGTDGARPASPALVAALRYAYERNVVLVAAAADAPVEEQGDPANVLQPTGTGADLAQGLGLSVTAANAQDQRATFAGLGSQISLAAYGAWNTGVAARAGCSAPFPPPRRAWSARCPAWPGSPRRRPRGLVGGDPRYAYLQGTSMATPMVAAVGAMVRALNPDLTAADAIRLLKQSARRPPGTGWEPALGWGILDAGAALEGARTLDRRAPVSRLGGPRRPRTARPLLRVITRRDDAPPRVVPSGVARVELWRSVDGRRARRIATARAGHALPGDPAPRPPVRLPHRGGRRRRQPRGPAAPPDVVVRMRAGVARARATGHGGRSRRGRAASRAGSARRGPAEASTPRGCEPAPRATTRPAVVAVEPALRALPAAARPPPGRRAQRDELGERLRDPRAEVLEVRDGVVVGEQAEVHPPVVAHDRDGEGVPLGRKATGKTSCSSRPRT